MAAPWVFLPLGERDVERRMELDGVRRDALLAMREIEEPHPRHSHSDRGRAVTLSCLEPGIERGARLSHAREKWTRCPDAGGIGNLDDERIPCPIGERQVIIPVRLELVGE